MRPHWTNAEEIVVCFSCVVFFFAVHGTDRSAAGNFFCFFPLFLRRNWEEGHAILNFIRFLDSLQKKFFKKIEIRLDILAFITVWHVDNLLGDGAGCNLLEPLSGNRSKSYCHMDLLQQNSQGLKKQYCTFIWGSTNIHNAVFNHFEMHWTLLQNRCLERITKDKELIYSD